MSLINPIPIGNDNLSVGFLGNVQNRQIRFLFALLNEKRRGSADKALNPKRVRFVLIFIGPDGYHFYLSLKLNRNG